MANNPVVNSLTFTGSVAGQASIQSQGIAGNLTFLLPNTAPITGQLVTVSAINGNNVFLGWSSQQSLTNIPLSALAQSGATTGQVIEWNGSAWVASTGVPGSGTVTSVTFTGDGTVLSSTPSSAVTTSGTLTATLASQTGNVVLASPVGGGSGAPTFRKVAIADINSIEGVGSKIQTTSAGTTVVGDIVTYSDTAGTIGDSGTLLSSLATTASLSAYATLAGGPTFSAGITVEGGNAQIQGINSLGDPHGLNILDSSTTGMSLTEDGAGGIAVTNNGAGGTVFTDAGTGFNFTGIVYNFNTGAINANGGINMGGSLVMSTQAIADSASSTGTSGQVLTAGTGGQTLWSTNISGNAASITGNITESQVTNLTSDLAAKAPLASPTFTGTVTIPAASVTGALTYTTANPTFFSAQGNGSKVQLSTGTTTTGHAVTYDANGNTIDSGFYGTTLQGSGANGQPAQNDNHIATGNNATFTGGTSGTTGIQITLSGNAAYSAANTYSVMVTPISTPVGVLWAETNDGTHFTVFSTAAAETAAFFWVCFGKTSSD